MTTPRALRLEPVGQCHHRGRRNRAGAEPLKGVGARERVPKGHKMAVAAVAAGEPIRKFGQIIGFASRPIAPGDWVHEHNCGMQTSTATTLRAGRQG